MVLRLYRHSRGLRDRRSRGGAFASPLSAPEAMSEKAEGSSKPRAETSTPPGSSETRVTEHKRWPEARLAKMSESGARRPTRGNETAGACSCVLFIPAVIDLSRGRDDGGGRCHPARSLIFHSGLEVFQAVINQIRAVLNPSRRAN